MSRRLLCAILLPATLGVAVTAGPSASAGEGASIPVVNPSGEINDGVDGTPIADPAVLGWESDGGQVLRSGTDYGNGAWRFTFEDSEEVRQLTSHVIAAGESYSLRFDASLSGGSTSSRVITAELYVDDAGSPLPVATRTFDFETPTLGAWDHYHLAVPPGSLDAHVDKALGIRFRSDDTGTDHTQSFDNVRLDCWSAGGPDGAFLDDWETTANQVWVGPGYWANRLQDWSVEGNRVRCVEGEKNRRTVHRTGTSLRGDGGDFSLSVVTGLDSGDSNSSARSGFLIGAGANLDWRAGLLVHDSLGRDFGLFLGLRGDGAATIEDYSTGSVSTLDSGNAAGFADNTRLDLTATYSAASGEYTLTLSAFDPLDALLSTASTSVPSSRILGSFGLLSHRGNQDAAFWFDNFSGVGPALQPEAERHLAIIGAMHTLSRGTLRITAQLSPLSLHVTCF